MQNAFEWQLFCQLEGLRQLFDVLVALAGGFGSRADDAGGFEQTGHLFVFTALAQDLNQIAAHGVSPVGESEDLIGRRQ
jgi:hypothetical protein